MSIRRGEVYFVYLDPVFGREQGGYKLRPVVVLSINDTNEKPLVVTIVPGTSVKGNPKPYRNTVRVDPTPGNKLGAPTHFECHQIRAIDKGRFTGVLVGTLSDQDLLRLGDAVKYNLGIR